MPRFDQQCAACGWLAEIVVRPHESPPCPVCGGPTERRWTAAPRVRGDEIPGGLTLENLGHEPVTVYSHAERRRLMKERGLEEFVRHVPIPGTDKSPHTTSWAAVAPSTLADAKALLERVGRVSGARRDDQPLAGPVATPADAKLAFDQLRGRV